MRTPKHSLVFLVLLPMAGCWALSDAIQSESFAKNKPDIKVLAGKYVPTADTVQLMRDEGHYPKVETSLELSADGTFKMINMPDWCYGVSDRRLFRGSGKWEVVKDGESWFLSLKIESNEEGPHNTQSPIVEDSGVYWLWFYAGGAHGKVMVFEKKKG